MIRMTRTKTKFLPVSVFVPPVISRLQKTTWSLTAVTTNIASNKFHRQSLPTIKIALIVITQPQKASNSLLCKARVPWLGGGMCLINQSWKAERTSRILTAAWLICARMPESEAFD